MDSELTVSETLIKLGIALGLGLLVGMQRQHSNSPLAGIRTFPLVTMLGTVAGLLGGWVIAAGMLGLAAFAIASNLALAKSKSSFDPGLTTEVTLLLMFGIGAYLIEGYIPVAVVLVGTVAVLLHLKPELHGLIEKLGAKDLRAIMQFVLISLVILPVLPNEAYGPYKVLNPFKIWLLAVLTVGISLGGYVAYKLVGSRLGSILGGILGGLVSSTATTLSYARRAKESPQTSSLSALVIMLASSVVFGRVLFVIGVVAPHQFPALAGPLGAMLGATLLIAGGAWFFAGKSNHSLPPAKNPSELKPALIFAAMFAVVLVGVAAAKDYFGERGLYAVAVLSGLTDMDAITLSTLQTAKSDAISTDLAWRMILVASMANLVFKAAITATVGSRELFGRIAILFGIAFGAGLGILWLWPGQAGDSPVPNL